MIDRISWIMKNANVLNIALMYVIDHLIALVIKDKELITHWPTNS